MLLFISTYYSYTQYNFFWLYCKMLHSMVLSFIILKEFKMCPSQLAYLSLIGLSMKSIDLYRCFIQLIRTSGSHPVWTALTHTIESNGKNRRSWGLQQTHGATYWTPLHLIAGQSLYMYFCNIYWHPVSYNCKQYCYPLSDIKYQVTPVSW